jgi:hypothetical protein
MLKQRQQSFWLSYGNKRIFLNYQCKSLLLSINIFFVKALRQWRQIWEAMKQ